MRVYIFGASKGGEVAKALLEESGHEVMGFIDDFKDGCIKLADYKGPWPIVSEMFNNPVRLRIAEMAATFVHPTVYTCHNVVLGAGTFVKPKATIGAFVVTGKCCVIDSCVNIEHHTKLGDGVFVAYSAAIGSTVEIGDRSLIGANVTIMSGVKIGKDCTINCGAVVLRDVPDGTTVKPRC